MKIWIPDSSPSPLEVVKPVYAGQMPRLDRARLETNAKAGAETVLLLDTNVLGRMHQLALLGGHQQYLTELGLDQLLRVINQPDFRNLVIAAGAASNELPATMLHAFELSFEWFLRTFAPHFSDHPLIEPPRLSSPDPGHEFWDLPVGSQLVLAPSYATLLLLQLAMLDAPGNDPAVRFQRFVQLLLGELGILSSKELEVARWCLSPPIPADPPYHDRRKLMIENFAKFKGKRKPRSTREMRHIALNGAHDLFLITTAVHADAKGLEGVPQDTWIATFYGKLAAYCRFFNYLPLGPLTGTIVALTDTPSTDPGYWQRTGLWLQALNCARALNGGPRKFSTESEILEMARRAQQLLETIAGPRLR